MYRKNSEGQDDSAETNPAELPKGAKMQGVKAAEKEEANTTERAIGLHEDDERHVNKRGEVGKSSRRRIAGPDYGKKDVRGEVTTAAALSRRGSPASHRLRSASSPVIEQGKDGRRMFRACYIFGDTSFAHLGVCSYKVRGLFPMWTSKKWPASVRGVRGAVHAKRSESVSDIFRLNSSAASEWYVEVFDVLKRRPKVFCLRTIR